VKYTRITVKPDQIDQGARLQFLHALTPQLEYAGFQTPITKAPKSKAPNHNIQITNGSTSSPP